MADNPPSVTIVVLPLKQSAHEARLRHAPSSCMHRLKQEFRLTYAYKSERQGIQGSLSSLTFRSPATY